MKSLLITALEILFGSAFLVFSALGVYQQLVMLARTVGLTKHRTRLDRVVDRLIGDRLMAWVQLKNQG